MRQLFFRALFLGFALFAFSGCRTAAKRPLLSDLTALQKARMEEALELMKAGSFLQAARLYDSLALQARAKPSEIIFLFNAGGAYREAGQCGKSAQRYRRLLDRSLKQPLFKARGLLEASYSYECLGDEEAAYLSLRDLASFKSSLPELAQTAVYPARLSIAYARRGDFEKAKGWRSLALNGILKLRIRGDVKDFQAALSRAFYEMGRAHGRADQKLKARSFIRAFPYHQLYLLQALFVQEKGVWAASARGETERLFARLMLAIKAEKPPKGFIEEILKEGSAIVEKEKSPSIQQFYRKQAVLVKALLK